MGNGKGIQLFALISLFASSFAGCASSNSAETQPGIDQTIPGATKWGHYNGEPVTKWNPDGRTMTLLTELRYTDPHGEVWVAPIGSVCRWRINSTLPLVDHGRAVRRKIPECFRSARCRV